MKIAIVKLSALGDIIHAMIVLQFLKRNIPHIEIDWVVEETYKDLLLNNPNINKVHTVNLKKVKQEKSLIIALKEIKKIRHFGKYDLVIDMQGLIKSSFVSRVIPSDRTVGFDKKSLRENVASIFYSHKYTIDYEENIIIRNLTLLSKSLNFTFEKKDILNKKCFLYSTIKYKCKKLSKVLKNVIIIPGASHQSKCYSFEKYAELTNRLSANFLIIWGNDNEKILAEKIKKLSPKVRIVEKLSLNELISLTTQVDLVIGGDTGPTHMAWALNIPSITLFGPTPGYRNSCETEVNKILETDSIVNPLKINKNDYSILNIGVEEIDKMANLILNVHL
ncbi:lipopolysaccharide heptosyltransferase I [Candidatus Thioglobus sp.]|nr:lipopolysaccharide heptosyltransferase I [Candidatus Thioglobus sp.]